MIFHGAPEITALSSRKRHEIRPLRGPCVSLSGAERTLSSRVAWPHDSPPIIVTEE